MSFTHLSTVHVQYNGFFFFGHCLLYIFFHFLMKKDGFTSFLFVLMAKLMYGLSTPLYRTFTSIEELIADYEKEDLHPADVKPALSKALNKILQVHLFRLTTSA